MNIPFSLYLDIFIALLLIVTIGYALTLNNRLSMLRRDKEELQNLALGFGEATARAEASIAELGASIDVLQERIKRAESLREDLVFLVERGNGTADKLEELVRAARDKADSTPHQSRSEPAHGAIEQKNIPEASDSLEQRSSSQDDTSDLPSGDTTSDAERELLKALRSAG